MQQECTSKSLQPPKLTWLRPCQKVFWIRGLKEAQVPKTIVNQRAGIDRDLYPKRGRLTVTSSEKSSPISKNRSPSSENKKGRKRTKILSGSKMMTMRRIVWKSWWNSRSRNTSKVPIGKVTRILNPPRSRPAKLISVSRTRPPSSTTLAT